MLMLPFKLFLRAFAGGLSLHDSATSVFQHDADWKPTKPTIPNAFHLFYASYLRGHLITRSLVTRILVEFGLRKLLADACANDWHIAFSFAQKQV
mmetsp:Transcript_26879/g.42994  ORF Transcript_26879/g.42994 Transcript_26879/m.42994 type:complete len:95 (+) Transcript_26879:1923-2207(+)